jgi:hypothetical protein
MPKKPGRPRTTEAAVTKPWSIRGITHETRNAATKAAKDTKTPIGEWVERALLDSIQSQYQKDAPKQELGPTTDQMLTKMLEAQETIAKRLDEMNEKQSKPLLARILNR